MKITEIDAMKAAWVRHSVNGMVCCMECGVRLNFSPHFCAHLVSKGSNPGLRLDVRNIIPLCAEHHHQLDFGDKKSMKIWEWAEEVIIRLKNIQHNTPKEVLQEEILQRIALYHEEVEHLF